MRSLLLLGDAIEGDGRSIRLVRSLSRMGEVDVVCLDSRPEERTLLGERVRVHGLPEYEHRPRGLAGRVVRRFDAFASAAPAGKLDLVLAVGLPTLRPAARLAEERGARLVYDVRESCERTVARSFRPGSAAKRALLPLARGIARRGAGRAERDLLERVDLLIVPDRITASWLEDEYGNARPLVIADYPTRLDVLPEGRLRSRFGLSEADHLVVCPGPLTRGRGLRSLVRSAAGLAEGTHLAMLGRGSMESRLRLFADSPDLAGRIHFTGPVSVEDRPALLVDADLGVAPVGGTSSIHEFLAVGVPVLAAESQERRFLTEHEAGWVTAAADSPDLAAAIRDRLGEPGERERRGANGRRAHLEHFHWEAEEERFLSAADALGSLRLS